ncbi:MAG: hypothetical protein ABSH47_24640 [Bryobacteraceae bacterium]
MPDIISSRFRDHQVICMYKLDRGADDRLALRIGDLSRDDRLCERDSRHDRRQRQHSGQLKHLDGSNSTHEAS